MRACRLCAAQTDALALALQGAIAELTPRLADSAKRLDELTPKSGQPAPATDVAAKDLENEKKRHDRIDANLRAARAMLLEANDVSTRISAARRQLFAARTFARSSSVFNPQLWAAVGRELPVDAAVIRNLIDNWIGAIGERPLLAEDRHGRDRHRARAGRGSAWLDRPPICLSGPGRERRQADCAARSPPPGHLRSSPCCRSPASGMLAGALNSFDLSDPSMQGVIDAALEAARVLIAINALGRGLLAPGRAAWRLVPVSDRSAAILYRLAMTIAAIWAVERLVEPVADAAASLNIAVADAGRRRDSRRDRDRLCDAPARGAADGRARIAAKRGLGPLENARLGGRVDHFPGRGDRLHRLRHFPRQSGDLPQHRRRRPHHRRHHRPGRNRGRLQARWADWIAPAGDGRTAPQCARADLRHPARRRPRGGGDARLRGGAEAMGRAVAGHVRRAALGLFRLLVRRRHPVACRR